MSCWEHWNWWSGSIFSVPYILGLHDCELFNDTSYVECEIQTVYIDSMNKFEIGFDVI